MKLMAIIYQMIVLHRVVGGFPLHESTCLGRVAIEQQGHGYVPHSTRASNAGGSTGLALAKSWARLNFVTP
jgi:hypothetical protein